EHERLALYAAAYPAEAQTFVERCRELREAAFHVLDALAHQRAAPDASARAVDAFLARGRYAIAPALVAAALTWQHDSPFDHALDPVLDSLVRLLSTTERSHLRMCQADDCGWLFLDTSRTHQRRWCSMRGCGARAKARRHYRRHVTTASA
ncbi:MAG TPA: CGNR zinc finger domain-containing protein, partial [Ktedonobacterales bacterium]